MAQHRLLEDACKAMRSAASNCDVTLHVVQMTPGSTAKNA